MERKSTMESQVQDKDALMALLDEPFEDQVVEVEDMSTDIESVTFTVLDLLREIWNPECSALKNLRLLLACVSRKKYPTTTTTTDCKVRRMREGGSIKSVITELHRVWSKEGPQSPTCSANDMYTFIRNQSPSKLYSSLVSGLMTHNTFHEWINDYDKYVKSLSVGGDILATNSTAEEKAGCSSGGGLDALLDLMESDRDPDRMPQYISRMKNRRLFTVKTPGEIGSQLIRLDMYNIKDIANKERRDWWKYAKLRSQFLTTSLRTDRKRLLVRRLLDQVADDLRKIPGVTKEKKNVMYENGQSDI